MSGLLRLSGFERNQGVVAPCHKLSESPESVNEPGPSAQVIGTILATIQRRVK